MPGLDDAVELLDRSLAYASGALGGVSDELLGRPTPCLGWTLEELLAHMEDALDAFLEAAGGQVEVSYAVPAAGRVEVLRAKACQLLGSWVGARPARVRVGDTDLDATLLVGTAALEITLHGWDVAHTTGQGQRVPDGLAEGLLDVARLVVLDADRGVRFAPAAYSAPDASPHTRLLAFTGRV